ncbi:hypothetical protein acsn021_32640 [Anaerocolumna cellulosilytica]|uniref:Uncharacterized protein n=1 Tax=Anaerocolumna cellulosilytica TaxID=433286 RepID=A0A6S6R944_9FIRM|nr:pentapeptide repeat-containing protein [Anaerocolumna cellulosilytica]MBB5196595.1 uncharacterized protein YjbI with pentapeptide repeats [Anaerocolumna cellulosilytica]BCJ95695.1 hypothetical protein acsn021_32640 [Anaerocolumna cellulosilytica]
MAEKFYENENFDNLKMEYERIESYEFYNCTFKNCSFEECILAYCSLIECKFINCKIVSLKVEFSQIKYTEFEKCNLIGVNWYDLSPTGGIADPITKFKDCILKYNSFMHINFRKFNFSLNSIQDSGFDECNLMESSFNNCCLEATQFSKCDMRKADFREATGYQISITTNKLADAKFSFPEAIKLLSELGIKLSY